MGHKLQISIDDDRFLEEVKQHAKEFQYGSVAAFTRRGWFELMRADRARDLPIHPVSVAESHLDASDAEDFL